LSAQAEKLHGMVGELIHLVRGGRQPDGSAAAGKEKKTVVKVRQFESVSAAAESLLGGAGRKLLPAGGVIPLGAGDDF
jgi:hypothetical protein